jgi:predicted transcriptional regulator
MKIICEIVVNEILPTIRASLAKELIASYNLNQVEVAELLDISQPAVSQYLRQLRGKDYINGNQTVSGMIKELASQIHAKQLDHPAIAGKMSVISKTILESGMIKDVEHFHKLEH